MERQKKSQQAYQKDLAQRSKDLNQNITARPLVAVTPSSFAASCKSDICIVTGLLYKDEEDVLRLSLFRSAGSPPHRAGHEELVASTPSTWSMQNLKALDILALLSLVQHAEKGYKCPLSAPVILMPLSQCAPDMMPFSRYFHAADKMDLVRSDGKLIRFHVDRRVFDAGTNANSAANLQLVMKAVWPEEQHRRFFSVFASPLNGVTLLEAARVKASIPASAKFYSFICPMPETREALLALQELEIDQDDPFVMMLRVGAYIYFDHVYDICAINALCFDAENRYQGNSRINYGTATPMPPMPINHLDECDRWRPVTIPHIAKQGFTHFTWVTPSEILGDHIFTPSGGFAYKHVEPQRSRFFPVVPPRAWSADEAALGVELEKFGAAPPTAPFVYDSPLNIEELASLPDGAAPDQKYLSEGSSFSLIFAKEAAALGIKTVIGVKQDFYFEREADAFAEMRREVQQAVKDKAFGADEEDTFNVNYVLDGRAEEKEVMGNDGHTAVRDKGHDGMRLQDFHEHEFARLARLDRVEVAALRLYTTSTFRRINNPLRQGAKPVPLPYTTMLIYNALKKMRAIHLASNFRFQKRYLWRGLKNCTVDENFLLTGGTELACMSTSPNMRVVAGYAKSETPLLFRILVDSPMEMGADIKWLSAFPGEEEVLYPPLTYLKPFCKQGIRGVEGGMVITLKPSFPT